MSTGRALAVAVVGTQGHLVEVEADLTPGPAGFTLLGLADSSTAETRDRVYAATANTGYRLPPSRITVTLSATDSPRTGTGFDLAIAAALLSATGAAPSQRVRRFVHLGELGLDGRVRPVRGVFPGALAAVQGGRPDLVVAPENAQEAALVAGARVWAVRDLRELVSLFSGEGLTLPPPAPFVPDAPPGQAPGTARRPAVGEPDLADLVGQHEGRAALEVAAAGGHHLLMTGPPGVGAPMLAARLPGLLADLDDEQAMDVTAVHSVAATLDPAAGLIRRPPFESLHHTSTVLALIGGGRGLPRPGAASRAHHGVLFLDEAREFRIGVLDALREPLDTGELVIHRANGRARFPARFQLVLASAGCPCGRYQPSGSDCRCGPARRARYQARLPDWLLDRVGLQIDLDVPTRADLGAPPGEDTATVAARVAAARTGQGERLASTPWNRNHDVPGDWLRGNLKLPRTATRDLERASDLGRLSPRGYDQALRIAWTLSDLAGRSRPKREDLRNALALRLGQPVTA